MVKKKVSRVIGGKRYSRTGKTYATKSAADKVADKLRSGGTHVRVVPYMPNTGKPYRYRIYKR